MPNYQRNDIWNFFNKIDKGLAQCSVCRKNFSYKTTVSNLSSHLRRKHASEYTIAQSLHYKNNQKEMKNGSKSYNSAPSTSGVIPTFSSSAFPTASTLPTPSSKITFVSPPLAISSPLSVKSSSLSTAETLSKQQKVIGTIIVKKLRPDQKKKVDRDLLDLFIKDFQPFSIVEDVGFKKLTKWIPGYVLPERKNISSVMLPDLYHESLESIKKMVLREAKSICISTSCWTSSLSESYITISAQYITEGFDFRSILLKCSNFSGSLVAENLLSEIMNVTTEWKLQEKVNFAVLGNTINIASECKNLDWKHYECYAHSLNLIIQNSFQRIKCKLDKVKKIVAHFNECSAAREILEKYQVKSGSSPPKTLTQDGGTQWNSTYHMLCKFVALEEAVKISFTTLSIKKLPVLTGAEWQILRQLCEILSPFEEMTNSICGQKYMTGSLVIVVTICLMETFKRLQDNAEYSEEAKSFILSLVCGLEDKFKFIEQNVTLALCTLLDPRYKEYIFLDRKALENAKQELKTLVVALIERENSSSYNSKHFPESSASQATSLSGNLSVWSFFNKLVANSVSQVSLLKVDNEIESYFADHILPRLTDEGKNNCPLSWWKRHQYIYPNLAEIYRKKCNLMATSVSYGKLLSKADNLSHNLRTRMTSKEVEMLLFLNANCDC